MDPIGLLVEILETITSLVIRSKGFCVDPTIRFAMNLIWQVNLQRERIPPPRK